MKKKLCAALLAAALAALTGCGGSGEGNTADAEGDKADAGEITVYTALEDEQVTDYLAKFNETYPDIKVNVVRESTGIITAKLIAEKDNPQADVVWGTAASSMMVLDDMDALQPYEPEGCDRILAQFKSDKEVPTWVGIDAWETAFVVNTAELEKLGMTADEITSYEDLLDPRLKGHIVMSNPNSSGTGFLTVSAVLQLKGKDTEEGWNYLDQLHENVAQYVHSGSKPAKMAASGECAVESVSDMRALARKRKGLRWKWYFRRRFRVGSGSQRSDGEGWINPAAYTFLDWAISDDAMDLYRENYPIVTVENTGEYEGYEGIRLIS